MDEQNLLFNSIEEALLGSMAPQEVLDQLTLVEIPYWSFKNTELQGQLVVHKDLANDVVAIFNELRLQRFPIQRMIPIAAYNWDDDASMVDNNTSAFNYRYIVATQRLSNHSFGRAIDINPMQNPYFAQDGKVYPNVAYDPRAFGVIANDAEVVRVFESYGWEWLGKRVLNPDYQHFQKI